MVFVRNEHGSHNPDEAMAMEDFAAAFRVLAAATDRLLAVA
jgi:N-carbamoyl-L-amino-acid hydrolase